MSSQKSRIVVVGGGIGAQFARQLSSKLDASKHELILINNRPFFTLLLAGLRMAVTTEGQLEDSALIPFDKLFPPGKPGTFKLGAVTAVEDTQVILESGETVPYDYLVLAPGSTWEGPVAIPAGDKDAAVAHVNAWRDKFAKTKSVAIIGGGAVGLELAGEIKEYYPETVVTIVHSEALPLKAAYPDKFRKAALNSVTKRGIKLVLEDRAEPPTDSATSITTQKGVKIDADLIIPARGGRPNTGFLRSFDGSILTPSGHVKVLPTLQVQLANDKRNIYAMGDIIDWPEEKQIAKGGGHISVVLANILSALDGKPTTTKYKTSMEGIFVTNGKGGYGFAGVLWGLTFGDWVVGAVKAKGLFISQVGKQLGY